MKKQKKPIGYYIGNLLMILAVVMLLIIYYPYILFYLSPHSFDRDISNASFSIEIPKIHIKAPIIENVDPFNVAQYRTALKSGVAHAKNTSFPGKSGTMYLFAHSSDYPWRIGSYNTVFFRLSELQLNDKIIIRRDKKVFIYKVFDKKVVFPSEVSYLTKNTKTQLILQTCTPVGTALQRLLIFASPS